MSSTFDGLYIAKSGVQAARIGLNVTGQNISNAGTAGYTRQRVDLSAISPTALQMLYAHGGAIVGEGVTATGISQLRNKFLDGQYRTQNAQCGLSSTQLSALQDIEEALNESTTDGLSAAFGDLIQQLEGLTSIGNSTATESTVKEAASLLATRFNVAASQLETIRNQQYGYLDQYGVDKVNSLLKNIAGLSDQIKSADIAGTPALELMDQRNQMIDELSQYVNIKVVETPTPVGAGRTVDTLSIYLADSKGDNIQSKYFDSETGTESADTKSVCLVDGNKAGNLDMSESSSPESAAISVTDAYGVVCGDSFSTDGAGSLLDSSGNSLFQGGSLSGYLKLLNESGEFDTPEGGTTDTERGIGYYEQMLDTLAQTLADVMNRANSTNDDGDNKPLFTDSDRNTAGITAASICISPDWTSDYLTLSKDGENAGDDNSGTNSNILAMITALTSEKSTLSTPNGVKLFKGTMQEAVTNLSVTLGQDIDSISGQDTSNSSMLTNIDTRRQAISSVDINEEVINLITFNQALAASARFMTTVDECLDTIINNMGIVGRG